MNNNIPLGDFQNWMKIQSPSISEEERITKELYEFNKSNPFENASEKLPKIPIGKKIHVKSFKSRK